MFIDSWILLIIFLTLCVIAGAIIKFLIRPEIEKEVGKQKDELYSENLELKKKIEDINGSQRALQAVNVERNQNLALLKIRALIVKFIRWEKPSRQARIILSLLTAILATIGIFAFLQNIDETQPVDFWGIAAFMFIFAYFIWGSIIETAWKQKQLNLMRREFFEMIRASKNPLEARDNLINWMSTSIDVADPVRRLIEGLLDKWLRQDLNKL